MFQNDVTMQSENAVIVHIKVRFTPEANDRFCRSPKNDKLPTANRKL